MCVCVCGGGGGGGGGVVGELVGGLERACVRVCVHCYF